MLEVIDHPCTNLNGGLTNSTLKLSTYSQLFTQMYLLVHALISMLDSLISVGGTGPNAGTRCELIITKWYKIW